MKSLLPFLILLSLRAAAELTIFDTRKTLPMSEGEPVFHDYYVNGGSEAGLTPGMVITITRRLPLYDTYQNHSAGDLLLKVAKVRVIQAQRGLAVVRQTAEFSRENAPLLEDAYIMIGDTLDLSTVTRDGKKSEPVAAEPATPSELEAGREPLPSKPVAQISVNAVDLSLPPAKAPPPRPPPAVDAPKLQ